MFFSESEQSISDEYLENGYVIRPVEDLSALNWIQGLIIDFLKERFESSGVKNLTDILNQSHNFIPKTELNSLRLKIIDQMNSRTELREMYYRTAKSYLEMLVGNEMAMQNRINLSIQLPSDDSSLLQVHADTWSGDSPFETVLWVPLVDCYKTKSMYILPPSHLQRVHEYFLNKPDLSGEGLYSQIKDDVKFLSVKFGEVLIFNQTLPHGNRINEQPETRWSMNCRFKGVFTPYGDKKIGEFFRPITLRAVSRVGMNYQLPTSR